MSEEETPRKRLLGRRNFVKKAAIVATGATALTLAGLKLPQIQSIEKSYVNRFYLNAQGKLKLATKSNASGNPIPSAGDPGFGDIIQLPSNASLPSDASSLNPGIYFNSTSGHGRLVTGATTEYDIGALPFVTVSPNPTTDGGDTTLADLPTYLSDQGLTNGAVCSFKTGQTYDLTSDLTLASMSNIIYNFNKSIVTGGRLIFDGTATTNNFNHIQELILGSGCGLRFQGGGYGNSITRVKTNVDNYTTHAIDFQNGSSISSGGGYYESVNIDDVDLGAPAYGTYALLIDSYTTNGTNSYANWKISQLRAKAQNGASGSIQNLIQVNPLSNLYGHKWDTFHLWSASDYNVLIDWASTGTPYGNPPIFDTISFEKLTGGSTSIYPIQVESGVVQVPIFRNPIGLGTTTWTKNINNLSGNKIGFLQTTPFGCTNLSFVVGTGGVNGTSQNLGLTYYFAYVVTGLTITLSGSIATGDTITLTFTAKGPGGSQTLTKTFTGSTSYTYNLTTSDLATLIANASSPAPIFQSIQQISVVANTTSSTAPTTSSMAFMGIAAV